MKFLHSNKNMFSSVISSISSVSGIDPAFIEKDYYIFMLLKLIYFKDNEVMFKGGTSLSKAWGILYRFSEDIDLNLRPEIQSTDSHRMKISNAVYNSIVELGFDYDRAKMGSRREYNTFIFDYNQLFSSVGLNSELKVETMANKKGKILNATYSMLRISNYIYDILCNYPQYHSSLEKYGLTPFMMPVQNMDVTFVEKIMSLSNRYLRGESHRLSRHLYDIYQMYTRGNLSSFDLNKCIYETKKHLLERTNDICLRQDRSAKSILIEALVTDFYMQDFNTITQSMKMNPNDGTSYEDCKNLLLSLLSNLYDF